MDKGRTSYTLVVMVIILQSLLVENAFLKNQNDLTPKNTIESRSLALMK